MDEQEDIRRYEEIWPKLRVLILGSYHGSKLQFLKKLKKKLNKEGFENVKLVRDFNYPMKQKDEGDEEYFYSKSLYWLGNADGYIWLFFDGEYDGSTIVEFSEFSKFLKNELKSMSRSLVILPEGIRLPTLLRGRIERYIKHLTVREIRDEDLSEAVESAKAFLVYLIDMLFFKLEHRRKKGKWEQYS